MVGTGLLSLIVGAALIGRFSPPTEASGSSTGGIQPWVFASHVRARWGRLLGQRTGDAVSTRPPRRRSWPETHLVELAEVAAAMCVAVAIISSYWAAGGSFGLSDARPDPTWALQTSAVAGAVVAAVGLLGLAGRWGHDTRFWLPVSLAWVGSGAIASFDGLNELMLLVGISDAESGWSLIDTLLVTKAVIGVLAGAVCALAVAAAAKDNRTARQPAPPRLHRQESLAQVR